MDPPPAPFFPSSPSPPSTSSSSSNASLTMVIITVVGILAAFALLASYYAFVTRCQPLRALWSSRHPPWHRRARGGGPEASSSSVILAAAARDDGRRGLGLPLIRMLPVVKFTAAACGGEDAMAAAARISVSECAVCLSEFVERERVRLLPNCSHAFHIDCIDTWLQGSARCPFCRSSVTLPAAAPAPPLPARSASKTTTAPPGHRRRDGEQRVAGDSIAIEVRGDSERWVRHRDAAATPAAGRRLRQQRKAESVGDEAVVDARRKTDEEFVVQPLRRSMSLDSASCDDKHLYVSVQEFLATKQQRQVVRDDPSVHWRPSTP